ncbi:MAG: DUF4361 domain-containing protein [Prevotellaceae bacterium]|jgi:hypothetical protein|nr:DUF4361 domain-containing protein [Prevotellaceae bacterium]
MKRILKYILTGTAVLSLMSCERDLLNEEHYRKIIYLKSGDNNIYSYPHAMNNSISRGYITVGSAGSMPLEKDMHVTFELWDTVRKEYNYRNFGDDSALYAKLLSSDRYIIPSYTVTLKAGNPSSTAFFPIDVDANGLSPDSTYMIPFRITSEDCEINPNKDFVLYKIDLQNRYSSSDFRYYKMKGLLIEVTADSVRSNITGTKELFPLAANRLRMFPASVVSSTDMKEINDKTMEIIINADSTVRIKPYKNAIIEQTEDKSFYNTGLKAFELKYRYKDSDTGNWKLVEETLTRIE